MINRILLSYSFHIKPAIAAIHGPHCLVRFGDKVRFGPIRQLSLFRSFSVNVLSSWLLNVDQWKSGYRKVTNEKPRREIRSIFALTNN